MFFSVITTNLTMETLTKNLVAFKRWERGGEGAWTVRKLKSELGEKEGVLFLRRGVSKHTMILMVLLMNQ